MQPDGFERRRDALRAPVRHLGQVYGSSLKGLLLAHRLSSKRLLSLPPSQESFAVEVSLAAGHKSRVIGMAVELQGQVRFAGAILDVVLDVRVRSAFEIRDVR